MTYQTRLMLAIQEARTAGFLHFAAALESLLREELEP